ncbi:hypothetical protein NEOLI_000351 [Neolecta irregularis DAH-3]|uniref:Uncharacterized protein n=1 Tax=Neolecta irregularis (strain DAH-3) TaxID=1198029 RepID=A0A1U7LVM1_NEOID|nr:hypothetical protein NEOLI_000351 [Neolecta irregularis DAH-3]|eukprot:OLL26720.1 hypothetical protein NEOLI_000351 [Neolecta irregularis DAH-3]
MAKDYKAGCSVDQLKSNVQHHFKKYSPSKNWNAVTQLMLRLSHYAIAMPITPIKQIPMPLSNRATSPYSSNAISHVPTVFSQNLAEQLLLAFHGSR